MFDKHHHIIDVKSPEDACNAEEMNVGPADKWPIMRDTTGIEKQKKVTLDEGRAKGMKIVLEERGIDTSETKSRLSTLGETNAKKMKALLTTITTSVKPSEYTQLSMRDTI